MMLLDLADVLRAAGLRVAEAPGWQTRARSGGAPYAPGRPTCLMLHHTASTASIASDVGFIVDGSPVAPIANIHTARDGLVTVCAAGPTNTNGKGSDTWGGGVPDDAMNLYAIGNEIANNGTGEPYPSAQQDAVLISSAALVARYKLAQIRGHFEWAPTRKIDPSGPSRWALYGGKWNMDALRADVAARLAPPPVPPTPPPTPKDIDMISIDHKPNTPQWTALTFTGTQLAWVINGHADGVMRRAGVQRQTVTDDELDGIIASAETTTVCPTTWIGTPREGAWKAQRA